MQTGYIIGFIESQAVFDKDFSPGRATFGEISKGVTAICAKPENARIWIWSAMVAFREQFEGKSKSEVDALLERYRTIVAPL